MAAILVVDDDPSIRGFLRDVCEQYLGHKVVEAATLKDAVALMRSAAPDAVLIDRHFGDGEVEDCLESLAIAAPETLKIPKWIITGERPLDWDAAAMAALGVEGYLVKPCRMDEIKAALQSSLAGGRRR
jgi:DNA-binding NarL/FixJ family response regulator